MARESRFETSTAVPEPPTCELSVDEARRRIVRQFAALPIEDVPARAAINAYLAGHVLAPVDLPQFTNAAMDGYAIRSSDVDIGGSDLPIAASIAAGDAGGSILPLMSAARIMTGAPLPSGADAVVPFEHAGLISAATVRISEPPGSGSNVRHTGEDVRTGDSILFAGRRIRPAHLAVLAASGIATIRVHRRPRVAVLATGNELVAPGDPLKPGQIWDANSAAIIAMIDELGGIAIPLGIARDEGLDLSRNLEAAARLGVDLLITSGGVSAGDFDVVKQVLRALGSVEIWRVRMKPGRPLAFGTIGEMPVLGLPGNPVAAIVSFLQFARPVILTMLGAPESFLAVPEVPVIVAEAIENPGGRRNFVRVQVTSTPNGFKARLAGSQGSANVAAFARANGLLVIPEDVASVEPGRRLMAQMPGWTLD